MEFTPSQIARLVLGYLKSEKCQIAFDAFFKTSSHFAYYSNNKIRSKYIVTRIQGYSLRDFLSQYAQIYNLIQERLEPTDYFEEYSSRNIVDQLIYLLDKCQTRQGTPQRSRSSTPIKETNKNKCLFQHSLSIIEENNTSELNTTPLEALPGNSNDFFVCTPKRKSGIRTNKNTVVDDSDSGDSPNNCSEEVEDVEVLKQTFLEHPELHEKIAENINLVIKTAEVNTNSPEEKVSNELDTAIKAIVERTQADPIFEKLIDDLIGPSNENDETNKKFPTQKEFEPEKSEWSFTSPPKTCTKQLENGNEVIKERQSSTLKQICDKIVESNVHTETKMSQTEEIQSEHNSVRKVKTSKELGIANVDLQKNLMVNTNSGDVILYDGTLDNYMKNSTPPVINQTNPLLLNNNLLMIQPGLLQQAAVTTPIVNANQIDKPYYVLNSTQLINVSVPQYKVNNVTEQDILNMPTIIVCDDDNQQAVATQPSKPTYSKQPQKILPKENPETNIREYLTLYKCTEENQSAAVQPTSKPQSKSQKKTSTQKIHIEILKPPEELVEKSAEKEGEKEEIKTVPNERIVSPRPVTPDLNKQNTRKTTPKSGSHVRALDFNFNTPGYGHLPAKKVSTSPKSPRKKTPNKTSSTKISKSLFGTPSKNTKTEITDDKSETKNQDKTCITKNNSNKQKKLTSWDADLRALMGPVKEPSPPKKKKKDSSKRSTKKVKSKLNNTEIDAEAIEKNLKEMDVDVKLNETEIKTKEENCETFKIKEENVKKQESSEETHQERLNKVENEDDQATEFTVTLINCNAKSKFKKKCNIDNNISKAVKITKVKEIKSLELVPDSNNKLILSPSKLNANKRTLVENVDKETNLVVAESTDTITALTGETSEVKAKITESVLINEESVKQDEIDSKTKSTEVEIKSSEEQVLEKCNDSDKKDSVDGEAVEKSCSKFMTPEMPKIPNVFPVTANRNLISVLETPTKSLETPISNTLPKTPGAYTPNTFNDTPMTKMLNEQLQGVDILSIQTPNFPLTPSLPFTPCNTKSPYPHRSTDYSTASSYYQPSDSEQNKSLEVLLQECKRLENQKLTKAEEQEPEVGIQSSIHEKICSFNQNLIAKKNLSLVKKDLENSSSDENTSSDGESSSSSDDDDDTSSNDSLWRFSPNETVVSKKGDTPYLLRSRKKEDKDNGNTEKIKTIQDIVTQTEIKPELEQHSPANAKEVILKEIEEKRKRTIAKFKEVEKSSTKKKSKSTERSASAAKRRLPLRDAHGKFLSKGKTKSKRVVSDNMSAKRTHVVNKRKSRAPMKLSFSPGDTAINDNIRDVTLHISSDDDNIKPFDVVETELLESPDSSISHPLNTFKIALDTLKTNLKAKESNDSIPDQEAEILVQGLKERGIYLVPNKTPNKQSIFTKNDDLLNLNCEKSREVMSENENVINESINICKERETHSVYTKSESSVGNKLVNIEEPKSEDLKDLISLPSNINLAKAINKDKLPTVIDKIKDDKNDIDDKLIVKNIKHKVDESNSKSKSVEKTSKLEVLKCNDPFNISLEDGEILSDNESEKLDVKSNLKNNNKSTKTPSKTNNSHSKKNISKHSSLKSSKKESTNKNRSRKPSVNDNKKRSEKSLKHASQSKFDKLDDSKSNCDSRSTMQKQDSCVLSSIQNPSCNIEQDLNLTDSVVEETFDDKVFVEETIKLVYDHRKTCGKTLNDYDLPISNKCFVVEVYGEQIEMSVMPFKVILDIPEKKSSEKIKILQNTVLTIDKNSSRLNNMEINSPLENLYSESNTVKYQSNKVRKLKLGERRRNSADQKSEFQAKSGRNTRSKSVDYYSLNESVKKDDIKCAVNVSNNVEDTDVKENEIDRNSSEVKDVDDLSSPVKPSPRDIDDDLMNYAICGSERIEDDAEKSRPTKRKAKDDVDDTQLKKKCQELLKNINVDVFLTQLHGDN